MNHETLAASLGADVRRIAVGAHLTVDRERKPLRRRARDRHLPDPCAARGAFAPLDVGLGGLLRKLRRADRGHRSVNRREREAYRKQQDRQALPHRHVPDAAPVATRPVNTPGRGRAGEALRL